MEVYSTSHHLYGGGVKWDNTKARVVDLKLAGLRYNTDLIDYCPVTPGTYSRVSFRTSAEQLAALGKKSVVLLAYGPNPSAAAWEALAADGAAWDLYQTDFTALNHQAIPPAGPDNAVWRAMADAYIDMISVARTAYENADLDPDEYIIFAYWNEPGGDWSTDTGAYTFHEMSNYLVPLIKEACGGSRLASPAFNGFHTGTTNIAETASFMTALTTLVNSGEPHLLLYDIFAINFYITLQTVYMADALEAYLATVYKASQILDLIRSTLGIEVQCHEFGITPARAGMTQLGRVIDHRRRGRMLRGMMDALTSLPFGMISLYVLYHGALANDTDNTFQYGLGKFDGVTAYAAMQEFAYFMGVELVGSFTETG